MKKTKVQIIKEVYVGTPDSIHGPKEVSDIMQKIFSEEPPEYQGQERFWIMNLNTKNQIKKINLVAVGGINFCAIDVKIVLRDAIINMSSNIVAVHSHPSGDPTPSSDDIEITKKLKNACETVDIKMLDHIIIGKDKFYSFKEHDNL